MTRLFTFALLLLAGCYAEIEVEDQVFTPTHSWDSSIQAIRLLDGDRAANDFVDAVQVNIRPSLQADLAPMVAAIRHAERGGRGREYGVLNARAEVSYRAQAGWCAATVQKNYDRWMADGANGDFVSFLGQRYAPIGASNDPNGLNRNWVPNVSHYYREF